MKKLICWLKRHHEWQFAYNYGVPRGSNWGTLEKLKKEGKTFEVNKCRICKIYDHKGDGLGARQFGANYDE